MGRRCDDARIGGETPPVTRLLVAGAAVQALDRAVAPAPPCERRRPAGRTGWPTLAALPRGWRRRRCRRTVGDGTRRWSRRRVGDDDAAHAVTRERQLSGASCMHDGDGLDHDRTRTLGGAGVLASRLHLIRTAGDARVADFDRLHLRDHPWPPSVQGRTSSRYREPPVHEHGRDDFASSGVAE